MNINTKLMQRIGYTLIVVSLVLFSISVFSVYSNSTQSQKNLAPNSTLNLPLARNVSAGDDILYSITPTNGTANITVYLVGPSGQTIAYSNASGASYTLTKEVVSPASGKWVLTVINHQSTNTTLKIIIGDISYTTLSMFLLGFAFLPSGIALVILSLVIRKRESSLSRYRF